ncbi:hypothetical protein V6N13_015985 [Hibiscus sabdariffa]
MKLDFDLVRIPICVHLFNVPLELYSKTCLSYTARAISVPLYMDWITASTERLEFAKVCIEIEACAEIPRYVEVVLRNGNIIIETNGCPHIAPNARYGHNDKTYSEDASASRKSVQDIVAEGQMLPNGQSTFTTSGVPADNEVVLADQEVIFVNPNEDSNNKEFLSLQASMQK